MAIEKTEHRPFSKLTKDTPYLALTDELCGVNTLGQEKIVDISQTTFSFSWMKMYEF